VVLCARAAPQGCDIGRPGGHINHGRALGLQGSHRLAFAGPIEANRIRVNNDICPGRRIGPGYASNWVTEGLRSSHRQQHQRGGPTSRAPRAPLSQALSFRHSRSSLACLLAPILRLRPQMNSFLQMGSESSHTACMPGIYGVFQELLHRAAIRFAFPPLFFGGHFGFSNVLAVVTSSEYSYDSTHRVGRPFLAVAPSRTLQQHPCFVRGKRGALKTLASAVSSQQVAHRSVCRPWARASKLW